MIEYEKHIQDFEFALLADHFVIDGNMEIRYMIVLRHKASKLVAWLTDYVNYYTLNDLADAHTGWTSAPAPLHAITHFLNFVFIDHYDTYRCTTIEELPLHAVDEYLQSYARTKIHNDSSYPAYTTVQLHRNAISVFLYMYSKTHGMERIKPDDLIVEKIYKKDRCVKVVPDYRIKFHCYDTRPNGLKQLYRDMPLVMAERMINACEIHDPELTLAVVLGLYGGLRGGEICNAFRQDSINGAGFRIVNVAGITYSMEVDLTRNTPLRADGISTGRIKKRRSQGFFDGFVPKIAKFYRRHLKRIEGKPCEDTRPLFLNKSRDRDAGIYRAMTTANYRSRVKKIFMIVLATCRDDPDPRIRNFYNVMQGHTWGAHACRHWFTVALVINGCSITQIKALRGDSPGYDLSDYLARKEEFMREYRNASDTLIQMITASDQEEYE